MRNTINIFAAMALGVGMTLAGCDKVDSNMHTPEEAIHFDNQEDATYQISDPGVIYKIGIGTTTVSDKERTAEIVVTSPTGAVEGTHFTVSRKTITIPAGSAVDTIEVRGVYDEYLDGRKDTLYFVLKSTGELKVGEYNDTLKLFMRGPCFEGDVELSELEGTYRRSFDVTYGYGPYSTAIVATESLTETTALITVRNLFDAGFNDLVFKLDWTDPFNRILTLEQQSTGTDGSVFGSTYAGKPLSILANPNAAGTFSYCNGTFTIRYYLCMLADDLCAGPIVSTMAR